MGGTLIREFDLRDLANVDLIVELAFDTRTNGLYVLYDDIEIAVFHVPEPSTMQSLALTPVVLLVFHRRPLGGANVAGVRWVA